MTTRGQFLRSTVPGNVPAAGTRQPGELWINFPDLQLGAIDVSRNAQKLIAVRFFSTLANYVAGDFVIQGGKLYFAKAAVPAGAFNAGQWSQVAALTDIPALYVLPTASTTVLGGVMIDGVTVKISSGVISAAGLVTISATPPSPVQNGAQWYDLAGGQLYIWVNDGTSSQWVVAVNQSISGVYLPLAGGALTGPLTLAADPTAPLGAATKQYVDAGDASIISHYPIGDNRIINGDMRIDQRNNGASGTAGAYTVDRWSYGGAQPTKGAWGRNLSGASGPSGFPYCLGFQSSSAYTPLASDFFVLAQPIEADAVSDFAWGSVAAQPVTLSFWAYSSLAGTFGGSIRNYAGTRSYPFTYTLTAGVWIKAVITIPGDTAGAWVMSGNAGAIYLAFDLGGGANCRGPAGAWATVTSPGGIGANGGVNVVATNAAQWFLTGVKLEIGSIATPFNRQSLAKSMADCQRYFQWLPFDINFIASGAGQNFWQSIVFPTMRSAPTLSALVADPSQTQSNGGQSASVFTNARSYGASMYLTAGGAGNIYMLGYRASASAEL